MAGSSLTFSLFGRDINASSTLERLGTRANTTAADLGRIGATGAKFAALAQGAASAYQVISQLGPAVALVAPAALAGAAAFGTLKLASDQIKKSFSALTPAVAQLKQVAGSNIAPGLTDLVNALKTDIPTVSAGVGSIAEQFSGIASYAASAFSGPLFRGDLATILDRTSQIVANLGGFVVDVGRAFISVGATAAPILGDLSNGLNDVVVRMQQWLFTATKSGQLTQLINNAVTGFKQLFGAVRDVGVGLGSIFSAISGTGGNVLSLIADMAEQFRGLATSAPFLNSIKTIFTAIHAAVGPLIPIIAQLVGVLASALAPIIGALLPPISQFAQILGRQLIALVPQLIPVVVSLATSIGQVLTALTPLLPPLAQLISSLAPLLPIVAQVAVSLVSALVPAIVALLHGLQPVIPVIVAAAQSIGVALGRALQQAAPALVQLIQAVVKLLPPLLPLIPAVARLAVALMPVITLGVRLAAVIATILIPVIAPLVRALVWLATTLTGIVTWATRTVIGWIGGLIGALGKLPGGVASAAGALSRWFSSLPGIVGRAVGGAGTWLWEAGKNLIRGFIGGISSMVSALVGTAMDVARAAVHGVEHFLHIGSPSRVFHQIGIFAGQGLINGLTASQDGARAAGAALAGASIPAAGAFGGGSGGGGTGGLTVNLTINGSVTTLRGQANELAPYVRDAIVRIAKTNGGTSGIR